MPRDFDPSDPPGEDTLELPRSLGRFVAACTWVRNVVLSVRDTLGPPSLRRRATGRPLATDPG